MFKDGKEVIAWLLMLLVLAAFMGLQIWIERQYSETASMALVSISAVIEIGLVYKIYQSTK